jgi:hypothetical protein
MTKDEALKMAIEAMEEAREQLGGLPQLEKLIQDCKEALEQPAQEPKSVGFIRDLISIDKDGIETYKVTPVYTHPHQWQGLTDDEIQAIRIKTFDAVATNYEVYRAIEQALKEKNHD